MYDFLYRNVPKTSEEQKVKLLKLKPGNLSLFLKGNGYYCSYRSNK